jgi:N-acetylglucosaminyldiphosphoundecaprenol N-acetyl-beta-D-mannosaminyltransferase
MATITGAPIALTTIPSVLSLFETWVASPRDRVVLLRDVHGAMRARREAPVAQAQAEADLVLPDGMAIVWAARLAGARGIDRVCGIDLLPEACRHGLAHGWRHYLYGASPGVANALAASLRARFPGILIVGTASPPFRPLSAAEDEAACAAIRAARPDIVWVSLSTPKQDLWMQAHRGRCGGAVMVGVGGAFEINAGLIQRAPYWMQQSGLEWLYRLGREPARLWHRYLASLPPFVVLAALEIMRARLAPVAMARRRNDEPRGGG